jgi:hypothetical protein
MGFQYSIVTKRKSQKEIQRSLNDFPVVGPIGRRQAGKTSTLSAAFMLSKGFRLAFQEIEADHAYMITEDDENLPLDKRIWAVPYQDCVQEILPSICE